MFKMSHLFQLKKSKGWRAAFSKWALFQLKGSRGWGASILQVFVVFCISHLVSSISIVYISLQSAGRFVCKVYFQMISLITAKSMKVRWKLSQIVLKSNGCPIYCIINVNLLGFLTLLPSAVEEACPFHHSMLRLDSLGSRLALF